MIAVKNIEKSFDGIPVLKGISTEFDKVENQSYYWTKWLRENRISQMYTRLHRVSAGEIIYNNVPFRA